MASDGERVRATGAEYWCDVLEIDGCIDGCNDDNDDNDDSDCNDLQR